MSDDWVWSVFVSVRDVDCLSMVQPKSIISYLKDRRWLRQLSLESSSCWSVGCNDAYTTVRVPHTAHRSNYAYIVGDVIEAIGKVEGRSQLAVLRDLFAIQDK